jgi:ABC-type lipoprotein export system ATPase subunit
LPETGFLLLDEPTANVDNKRKSALKTFIQALSETSDSKNNQIILIEHDQDVVELCQSKLEISNTNKIETT